MCSFYGNLVLCTVTAQHSIERETASFGDGRYGVGKSCQTLWRKVYPVCYHHSIFINAAQPGGRKTVMQGRIILQRGIGVLSPYEKRQPQAEEKEIFF